VDVIRLISYILLVVIVSLIILGYLGILISFIKNSKKNGNESGMDVAFNILSDDSAIKLVKGGNDYFSSYNISRKMIRLASNTYDGYGLLSRSIASFLAGCAVLKSKYFNILVKCGIRKIKIISFSSIIVLLVSIFVSNSFDAKIGILILALVGVYQYILNEIYMGVISEVKMDSEVLMCLSFYEKISKLFFITTLIAILRMVIIILGI